MKAKKSLGQHFLIAPQSIKKTVESAKLTNADTVLEIGPGNGALTKELLSRAGKVIAVEKDGALIEKLTQTFKEELENKKLELVHGDILECDFNSLGLFDKKYKVVANIPYYITGILIRTLLTNEVQPNTVVLIVQKEIAERVACLPAGRLGRKKESLLSLSVKAYGIPKYIGTIKRGAFRPSPKVDSAILLIENISKDFFSEISEKTFFELLKAGFSSKRKFLVNNLEILKPKDQSTEIFRKLDMDPKARAEDIKIEKWRELASELSLGY